MILTICLPTIETRKPQFMALENYIRKQLTSDVEIVSLCDNKEISIGSKRQKLLEMAQGRHVVMIDDDDEITEDYVSSIVAGLSGDPDCVGFQIECHGMPGKLANVSNKYRDWAENEDGFDYVRTPYYKVPIRLQFCRQIGFSDMRWREDHDFSKRLKDSGLVKSEFYIPRVLYKYRYSNKEPHDSKYGIR